MQDDQCRNNTGSKSVSGSPNVCVGKPYTCPKTNLPLDMMNCYLSTACDGRGDCIYSYKPRTVECFRNDSDLGCTPVSFCSGNQASCSRITRTPPNVKTGMVQRRAVEAAGGSSLLPLFLNLSVGLPLADLGSPYPLYLPVWSGGWDVTCGPLTITAGLYVVWSPGDSSCLPARVLTWTQAADTSGNFLIPLTYPTNGSALPDGTLVRYVARGRNIDGVANEVCGWETVTLDTSPPLPGIVTLQSSRGANPAFLDALALSFSVSGFSDPHSEWSAGLKYEYLLAAYPLNRSQPSYWVTASATTGAPLWRALDFASSATSGLLATATQYQLFVRAWNRAGLKSPSANSSLITLDATGPLQLRNVTDGGVVAEDTAPFTVDWSNSFQDPESGLGFYEVGWGRTKGSDDVIRYARVELTTTALTVPFPASPGRWESGVVYYATVRAYSRSGAMTAVSAPGQKRDTTPPFNVQLCADCPSYTRFNQLNLTYSFLEPETRFGAVSISVASSIERAVGFLPADVINVTLSGGDAMRGALVPLPPHTVPHGQPLHVCIAIRNTASLWSNITCKAFTVDRRGPLPSGRLVFYGPTQQTGSGVNGTWGRTLRINWGELGVRSGRIVARFAAIHSLNDVLFATLASS